MVTQDAKRTTWMPMTVVSGKDKDIEYANRIPLQKLHPPPKTFAPGKYRTPTHLGHSWA